jgi:hypothetical protein
MMMLLARGGMTVKVESFVGRGEEIKGNARRRDEKQRRS